MKPLINALLFQGVWLVCVLGGDFWALGATLLYLFLHDHYFMNKRAEWRLVIMFFLLGTVIDGALFHFGVFTRIQNINENVTTFAPIWLLCLWILAATLFAHSLAFLRSRYGLSALLGFSGPPFSYAAGAKLAGIQIAEPVWLSLCGVGLIWMLLVPLGVYLCGKWALYSVEDKSV